MRVETSKRSLLSGHPLKRIIVFALPLLVGNLFQQFYSLVDSIIVDRTLGAQAFSGIGITGSIIFLVLGLAQGTAAGFSVLISQYYGAKDTNNFRKSIATSWILCAIISVVLTIVAVVSCSALLKLLDTPDNYYQYAYDYIIVIFYGIGASVFYNMVSMMLRAQGDSKTPLYFLIVASVINIVLDIVFITQFNMGVAGAGLATVISQVLAGVGCLIFMLKKYPQTRLSKSDWANKPKFYRKHLSIGLPMGFQFSIIAIGIMIQVSAVNGLGDNAITAYTAGIKIDNLVTQWFLALGASMATFCGQNFGAQQFARLKQGVKQATIFGIILAVVSGIMISLLGDKLIYLFVSTATEEQARLCKQYLTIQGVMYIFLVLIYVYRNSLQGMGHSNVTVVAGVLELSMRVFASFVLVSIFGFDGLCWSNPVAWVGACVVLIPSYLIYRKKLQDIQPQIRAGIWIPDKATAHEDQQ